MDHYHGMVPIHLVYFISMIHMILYYHLWKNKLHLLRRIVSEVGEGGGRGVRGGSGGKGVRISHIFLSLTSSFSLLSLSSTSAYIHVYTYIYIVWVTENQVRSTCVSYDTQFNQCPCTAGFGVP